MSCMCCNLNDSLSTTELPGIVGGSGGGGGAGGKGILGEGNGGGLPSSSELGSPKYSTQTPRDTRNPMANKIASIPVTRNA